MVKARLRPDDYVVHNAALGAGSFGVVSVLRHKLTGQLVARKQLKAHRAYATHGITPRVLREIALLQRYRHRNIVTLMDVHVDEVLGSSAAAPRIPDADRAILGDAQTHFAPLPGNSVAYLFLEYVEHSLGAIIHEAGTRVGRARTMLVDREGARQIRVYARHLLEGLGYLAERGVLHLDIKPDNLLVSKAGVLKIADFGIAREEGTHCRYTPEVVTATYRAPEIFALGLGGGGAGDAAAAAAAAVDGTLPPPYGHKADAWSAGCVLAEMYTCAHSLFHPVPAETTDAQIMHRLLQLCGTAGWPAAVATRRPPKNAPPAPPASQLAAELASGVCQRCAAPSRPPHCFPAPPADAVTLITQLLCVAEPERLTARAALALPYFTRYELPDAFPPRLDERGA